MKLLRLPATAAIVCLCELPNPAFASTLEVGASVGTPAILNANLGLRTPFGLPILIRAGGLYLSSEMYGLEGTIAAILFGEVWQHDLGASFSKQRFQLGSSAPLAATNALGIRYGLTWRALFAELGISLNLSRPGENAGIVKLGANLLF